MKISESVTFGGGGLDRAANIRGKPDAILALTESKGAGTALFWRGKPLIQRGTEGASLARLPVGHPLIIGRESERLFLGCAERAPVFAVDISDWEPEDVDYSTLGAFLDPTEQRHPDLPSSQSFAELRAVMTQLTALDAEIAATAKALFGWHESHRFCARCGSKSMMAMAGWQRDCNTCGGHHFPRTDPVVIMLITHRNDVLLGRSPGWPEGMYSLLAGFVEPGETIEAAVRREVFEESRIEVGAVSYLASQPWPFPSSLMIGCRGEAVSRDITVDPAELEDAVWVSREQLARAFAGEDPSLLPARKGAIAHFILWNWLADRLD
jgi:NAD+ diphosphatase